jgi:parallel beta-helix repeat protein
MKKRPLSFLAACILGAPASFVVGRAGGPAISGEPPSRPAAEPTTATATAPCVRVDKPGTQVRGEVKICPGRYRVVDRSEIGVIVAVASGTRIDLTGVTLESGDQDPSQFTGIGILSHGVDSVSVRGGRIRGFRFGIRLEGGSGHRVSGVDLSNSRAQTLRSTPQQYDQADWLDLAHPETFETYGAGVYLKRTVGASITGIIARGSQNGIGLFESREAWIADNDLSGNSGWGIHLWRSSRNTLVRNRADHNVRCESPAYRQGCGSAGLLLREQSDSNLIADNDLTSSGDGFLMSGEPGLLTPSIGNLVLRNDASHAWHSGFRSISAAGNSFIENRVDSADYGLWLTYSRDNLVRGNVLLGSRTAAIAIEHGAGNELAGNTIIGGAIGIRLFAPQAGDPPSRNYRIDDNTLAKVTRGIVLEHTTGVRLRGNLFDGGEEGLVVDSAGADAEVVGNVFLSAGRWFIDAVQLDAGGNFWGPRDPASVQPRLRGRVNIQPFRRASDAGY